LAASETKRPKKPKPNYGKWTSAHIREQRDLQLKLEAMTERGLHHLTHKEAQKVWEEFRSIAWREGERITSGYMKVQ
jgi:hypothetical protein